MGVVSSTLQPISRGANLALNSGGFTYKRTYRVRTDDPRDDERAVLNGYLTAGPDPGPDYLAIYIRSDVSVAYPEGIPDFTSRAQAWSIRQPDEMTPTLWEVEVTFAPLRRGQDPTFTESPIDVNWNPLNLPVEFYIDQQVDTRIVESDFQGLPVVNSAGQPFDEPAEEEVELEVMVFHKRFATIQEIRALNRKFRRKLNSDTFAGYPPGHCRCLPIRAGKRQEENGYRFYEATFRIVCNDRPWVREYVNRGFKHFQDFAVEKDGQIVVEKRLVKATAPLGKDPSDTTPGEEAEEARVTVGEPVLLAGGPIDATANLSQAMASDDSLVSITAFSAILPDDEPNQPSPLPTTALNPLGLAAASGTAVQLIWNGSSWSISKTPPDNPLPDKPPNRGYRLPDGRGGNVVGFQLQGAVAFTGASGLPFPAPVDA